MASKYGHPIHPWSVCMCYVHSFIHAQEWKSMGELLKQVSKESSGQEIRSKLRLLGSVFLNYREVSAQESVYQILSLPLKQLSRNIVFINRFKTWTDIHSKETQTTWRHGWWSEHFSNQPHWLYRYAARPTTLDNTTWSGQNLDEENHDSLPKPDEENKIKLQCILLSHDLGYMYKWRREAVVHFDKFNLAKESTRCIDQS